MYGNLKRKNYPDVNSFLLMRIMMELLGYPKKVWFLIKTKNLPDRVQGAQHQDHR